MIGFIFYPKSPRCLCEMPALPACPRKACRRLRERKQGQHPDVRRPLRAGLHPAPRRRIARVLPISMQQRLASHQGILHRAPQGFGVPPPPTRDYAIIICSTPKPRNMAVPATSSTGTCCYRYGGMTPFSAQRRNQPVQHQSNQRVPSSQTGRHRHQ